MISSFSVVGRHSVFKGFEIEFLVLSLFTFLTGHDNSMLNHL